MQAYLAFPDADNLEDTIDPCWVPDNSVEPLVSVGAPIVPRIDEKIEHKNVRYVVRDIVWNFEKQTVYFMLGFLE